jgi:hypothetical protein
MSSIISEQRVKEFTEDSKWLHTNYNDLINNYNDLINNYNGQFVAIRNKTVIESDGNLDELKEKLQQKGIELASMLVEYIKDKRYEVDW